MSLLIKTYINRNIIMSEIRIILSLKIHYAPLDIVIAKCDFYCKDFFFSWNDINFMALNKNSFSVYVFVNEWKCFLKFCRENPGKKCVCSYMG